MQDRLNAFPDLIDLASAALGGRAVASSDDFFASRDNLVKVEPAVFIPGKFTDRGKWMDGWESRRRRTPGHDWCVVALGVRGRIRAVDIDTAHFLGNAPPYASVDAGDGETWTEIVASAPLRPGSRNVFAVADDTAYTHVRLHSYPAGGVARLRVLGEAAPALDPNAEHDLACLTSGGRAVCCSDMFFAPMQQLLLPAAADDMGGGWETHRYHERDWIIVALGAPGLLSRIDVDTRHFKGNFPDRCSLDALYWPDAPTHALPKADWTPVVAASRLGPDAAHAFTPSDPGPWTHLRLTIVPDGGVSRMRAFGRLATREPLGPFTFDELHRCCGSTRWATAMAGRDHTSAAALFGAASVEWWRLGRHDWLEAFSHHPRIGEDPAKLRERFVTADLSASEQAGVHGASAETLAALADENLAYSRRFGHVFLVCATGRSADEMLAILRDRASNDPDRELEIAAGEQEKITRLRLEALLS